MSDISEDIEEGEIIRHKFVNQKTFVCDQCSFQSKIPFDIMTHKQNRHEQIKRNHNEHQDVQKTLAEQAGFRYKCSICDHQTRSKALFAKHKIIDHVFFCKKCPKIFPSEQRLHFHTEYIHKQVDGVSYKCTICDHHTKSKTLFSTHTNRVHEFNCRKCPEKFISQPTLYFHNVYKHEHDLDNNFSYNCIRCDYQTQSITVFTTHTTKHHRFNCNKCPKKFIYRQRLSYHINGEHEKKYVCSECDNSFSNKKLFKQHKKLHLDNNKPFSCLYCDKKFQLSYAQGRHMHKFHTKEMSWNKF